MIFPKCCGIFFPVASYAGEKYSFMWKMDTFLLFGSSDGVHFKILYRSFITIWCISFLKKKFILIGTYFSIVEENMSFTDSCIHLLFILPTCALMCLVCQTSLKRKLNPWAEEEVLNGVAVWMCSFQAVINIWSILHKEKRKLMFIS